MLEIARAAEDLGIAATVHSDISAALNMLRRAGGRLPVRARVLSFTPGRVERNRIKEE